MSDEKKSEITDERMKDFFDKLPEDLREKAKSATSREELKKILDNYDGFVDLTEDELQWVAGGCSTEVYGDERTDFDSTRMPGSFISGEDLGF